MIQLVNLLVNLLVSPDLPFRYVDYGVFLSLGSLTRLMSTDWKTNSLWGIITAIDPFTSSRSTITTKTLMSPMTSRPHGVRSGRRLMLILTPYSRRTPTLPSSRGRCFTCGRVIID